MMPRTTEFDMGEGLMEVPGMSGLSTGYNGGGVEGPVLFLFVYLASNSVKYIEIRCEQP